MSTPQHGPGTSGEPRRTEDVTSVRDAGEDLVARAGTSRSGRAARTLVALPGLRVTLLALTGGSELAEHETPGAATLHCLSGQATLRTADHAWPLGPHDLLTVPDRRHRLTAETDALVLLTVRHA